MPNPTPEREPLRRPTGVNDALDLEPEDVVVEGFRPGPTPTDEPASGLPKRRSAAAEAAAMKHAERDA